MTITLGMRLATLSMTLLAFGCAAASARDPLDYRDGTVLSSDGVPIHFREGGRGETALVFVHGWLGNLEWWTPTMERFAPRYRVVALDLAGHGSSGRERKAWTVERFGDDVAAVVRALDLERAVLLGHSMSGAITVQAARVLGERVVLLVPVDTLNDFEWDLPPAVWDQFFGGLRADFPNAVAAFFGGRLFLPSSPPDVVARVVGEARAADPAIAVPMLERARDFDLKGALHALKAPIYAINSDANPTNLETNRKYVEHFDVEVLPGIGHWPMLEDPGAFGDALERVLTRALQP
jgi:sigma-B regulation protein RsbQ